MISQKEFSTLKAGHLHDKIAEAAGKPFWELNQEAQAMAIATLERLTARSIPFPQPTRQARLLEGSTVGSSYVVARPVRGKGVTKQGNIRYQVFSSVRIEHDDLLWQHVSFVRLDKRLPTYEDLTFIKGCFFPDRWAIQVFPRPEQHISDHDACLHLWSCLERDVIPDFVRFGTI